VRAKGNVRWIAAALALWLLPAWAQSDSADSPWYAPSYEGKTTIQFYFFWSRQCPHCSEARPWVERLPLDYPWLTLHSFEISAHPENARRYVELAGSLGQTASAVPGFLFCGEMHVGYESGATTGNVLRAHLLECHRQLLRGAPPLPLREVAPPVALPIFGTLDPAALSLPLMTALLAGVDAFNPCAFFVLLFLLSLMVHARSRPRMALVGGVFVLVSGLSYFVFMAAWLNVFLLMGEMHVVTLVAGAVAVTIGGLNIKDYVGPRRGPSLSIPEAAKPGLFARMRSLLAAQALPSLLTGTVVLAIAANSYELLCTAGFPMVFTRILTLQALPSGQYYGYLLLYNAIYVVPLAIIVAVFTATLGARKLSERQGAQLKLLSGTMMLFLGALLLAAPQYLNNAFVALMLLAAALLVVGALELQHRRKSRGR
jgi:hypothetical protein